MTSSLSPSPIISSNIDTTTTTLNNTNKCTIQSPILYSNNPLYQKMKEFILDLCEQGIGAIESNEQIKIKYGVQAPTLCTIYKWRKEYRGGKGEKQILDNINIPTETMDLQQSQQNGKVIKKEFEKYCAECNREMSSRHYYEFHMLNVHDVLLGTTRATVELLGKMSSTRKQQLIFRCDSCSGVGKDYNNFEELQQHKINEHGEHLRIPALHFKKNNNKNNSSPPGKMKAHPKLARSFTTIGRGRDISLPLPTEGLRRSARIPKPTSAIIHSFFSAKDEIDSDVGGEQRKIKDLNKNDNNNGINRTLQGLKEEEARKDAQMNDCFKGRNWEIKEGNLGTKIFSKFVNKNKNNKNASLLKNSINEQKVSQEEEPFVTILNDGRIEVEETESKKAKNTQEKHQIISPSALEASDSMLMALASAALMEKNASETANNSVNPPTTLQASINNSTFPHSSISINSATYSTSIPLSSKVTTSSKNTINGTSKEKMFLTTKTHKKTKKNVVWNNKGKHAANNKNNNIEQNVSENVSKHTELQEHVDNNIVSVSHNAASTENNSNILTTTSQCFSISNEQIQTALFVSQDDSTWFGHSIAAQLRLMPLHIKELAKMRIQQVIFECNSTSIASFQQFAQLQSKLVIPSIINDSLIQNISSEQNGNKQALEVNCEGEKIEENNEDVVDVVTVEEQKQKEINKSL